VERSQIHKGDRLMFRLRDKDSQYKDRYPNGEVKVVENPQAEYGTIMVTKVGSGREWPAYAEELSPIPEEDTVTDFPCCETDSHATETDLFSVEVTRTTTETIQLTSDLKDVLLAGSDLYVNISAQERLGVAKYLLHRYPQREGVTLNHISDIIHNLRRQQ